MGRHNMRQHIHPKYEPTERNKKMKALLNSTILVMALLLNQNVFASVGDSPAYVSSEQDRTSFETAIRNYAASSSNKPKNVSCSNVFTVSTGGTMGTATAGLCIIDGVKMLACQNDMLGTISLSQSQQMNMTLESNLRILIDSDCTGG